MSETLTAVYEHGMLRPLQPVALEEGERVTLSLYRQMREFDPEKARAAMRHVQALAVARENDHFSGEAHDEALYGEEAEQ